MTKQVVIDRCEAAMQELADFLRTLPKEKYNQELYMPTCKTPGCAAGWAIVKGIGNDIFPAGNIWAVANELVEQLGYGDKDDLTKSVFGQKFPAQTCAKRALGLEFPLDRTPAQSAEAIEAFIRIAREKREQTTALS